MADLVRLTETAKEGLWGVEDLALANPEPEEGKEISELVEEALRS